jgi:hypothetical protein
MRAIAGEEGLAYAGRLYSNPDGRKSTVKAICMSSRPEIFTTPQCLIPAAWDQTSIAIILMPFEYLRGSVFSNTTLYLEVAAKVSSVEVEVRTTLILEDFKDITFLIWELYDCNLKLDMLESKDQFDTRLANNLQEFMSVCTAELGTTAADTKDFDTLANSIVVLCRHRGNLKTDITLCHRRVSNAFTTVRDLPRLKQAG